MASTSSVTLQQQQQLAAPTFAPDDSDLLDSDVDQEKENDNDQGDVGREIEAVLLAEPNPSEIKRGHAGSTASPSRSSASSAPRPSHDLIQVSRRLWFTYFTEPAPSPALLNRKNGRLATPPGDGGSSSGRYHWFNVDNDLVYLSFFDDWGPLNVAMFYRFCLHVHHLLTSEEQVERLVLYTADTSYSKANTALLAALYAMIIDKVTPADAFHPFSQLEFEPFRDAGYGRPDFYLTIQDILYGMQKAISLNLLDLITFNLDEYEHFEQVQNGDWNWLTPNFIAFASPNDRDYVAALRTSEGRPLRETFLPKPNSAFASTIRQFKDRGVKLVVRLNNPLYDKVAFEEAGIEHLDLYFDDGSNPSDVILDRFIEKADEVVSAGGVVAVHCKAGLGRTGVLIGGYLIWKHGFTASEVIGFMRLMRPGCVVGPQQHFMYENFVDWIRKGARESALKEAHATLAREREALLRAGRLPTALSGRISLKRPATPDEGDDREGGERNTSALAGEDSNGAASDLPVTPRARKDSRLEAAATATVKPTPCVGQPRKSPSPSRKRVAPATVARLERNGGGGGGVSSRPGLQSLGFHQPQFRRVSARSGRPPASTHSHSENRDSSAGCDENDNVNGGDGGDDEHGVSPGGGGGGGGGNVLMEAQRHNVQRIQPASSPKMALQAATAAASLPPARGRGHERSRSAAVLRSASSELSPGPSLSNGSSCGSPKLATARASPDIKTRYQLRDAGSRGGTPSSPEVASSFAAPAPAMMRADIDVLGVEPLCLDLKAADGTVVVQQETFKGTSTVPTPEADVLEAATTMTHLRSRSKTPAPGSDAATGRPALSRNASNSSTQATVTVTAAATATSTTITRTATITRSRQPSGTVTARPATSIGVRGASSSASGTAGAGTRSTSGKLRDARAALTSHTADARLRAGSTRAAQDMRRSAKAGEASGSGTLTTGRGMPGATAAVGGGLGSSGARQVSRTRPSSRLLAPTAASAARAAATLKRSRVISPDPQEGCSADAKGGEAFPHARAPSTSSSSSSASTTKAGLGGRTVLLGSGGRIGRSVRRRRSSMGDADIDVIA